MIDSETTGWTMPDKPPKPRFGLGLTKMLALIAVITLGYVGTLEYFSPARVWRRVSRDPQARSKAWVELEREHLIEGLDRDATIREVFLAMDDPDPEVRGWAVWCAPTMDADPLVVINRLAGKLGETEIPVRNKAAVALGEVVKRDGPGREEALIPLSKALKDDDPKVRRSAVVSIGQIVFASGLATDPLRSGRKDDPALNLVAGRLQDDDITVKVEAAFVLGCNDRGGEAVPILTKYINEQPRPGYFVHEADRAFMALTLLAVRSSSAINFLMGEMTVEREGYPDRPRAALAWAARQSPEALSRVRRQAGEALKTENLELRYNAAFLMHDIGAGVAALDQLLEALGDPSVEFRIRAIEILADLGEVDPRVVPALTAASNDAEFEVRERAVAALESIEIDKMFQ